MEMHTKLRRKSKLQRKGKFLSLTQTVRATPFATPVRMRRQNSVTNVLKFCPRNVIYSKIKAVSFPKT